MTAVLLLAAVAILAGVVLVAIGYGGELAVFAPDTAPEGPRLSSAADITAFRPPAAFFGYSASATDAALQRIARSVAQRDDQLAALRRQLADLAVLADASAEKYHPAEYPEAQYPEAQYPEAQYPEAGPQEAEPWEAAPREAEHWEAERRAAEHWEAERREGGSREAESW